MSKSFKNVLYYGDNSMRYYSDKCC